MTSGSIGNGGITTIDTGRYGVACGTEFQFIGIEKDLDHYCGAVARINEMPPLLFLVVSNNTVHYHCHSILELFRLRAMYSLPDDAAVYRYVDTVRHKDAFFLWDKDKLTWVSGGTIGFALSSFDALKDAHATLLRMKKK